MQRQTACLLILAAACLSPAPRGLLADQDADLVRVRLRITTPLTFRNTPLDPTIDFPALIREAGLTGVVDPNSIEVVDSATGKPIPHALTEDFAYRDQGRIEFVVAKPVRRDFEILFRVVAKRQPLLPAKFTPTIGVGDVLRYNSGRPGPITLIQSMGLHDVTGDGRADLVGTWNYYYRPGSPTGGVVFYPAVGDEKRHALSLLRGQEGLGERASQFGDLQRLRYQPSRGEPRHFSHHYNSTAFADFNSDGRIDFVYTRGGSKTADFYLATEKRDPGGASQFVHSGSVAVNDHKPCRAVDLDGDGAIDLVINGQYIRNTGSGWPFKPAKAVKLDAGAGACFTDIDSNGRVDSICLVEYEGACTSRNRRIAWRRNVRGGDSPVFAESQPVPGVELDNCTMVAAANVNDRSLLLVQTGFQQIHIFERTAVKPVKFEKRGRAESMSAVMSLSDQAWPCLCDWDADGDLDLLIGNGYGWPRIVINEGSRTRPKFAEPKRIEADEKPIRFLRDKILGSPRSRHNMGYVYPVFVDWDGDKLPDLVCPNETNRLFWYRNIGTRKRPRFGKRRQILCDGYPDSQALRDLSAERAADRNSNNGVYPYEKERPFMWRTGAAFADFNGDKLPDLVTHDGYSRVATLFAQYRDGAGVMRLRKERVLKLDDGQAINDSIVARRSHWTESFRAIDWDGDGLTDLIYSLAGAHNGIKDNGSIYLLRNCGTTTDPRFEAPTTMRCFGEPIRITNHGPHPWPGDFDGDGTPDLITCVEWSVYPFYSHAALMMKERPKYTLELQK
jgi:hypothetical protein